MPTQCVSKRSLWAFTALFILVTLPAPGREKSDQIILKNGDRISGEITRLDQGMLSLKTDSMGTVQIKWEDVSRVTSRFHFRLEDSNGRLYYGALESSPEAKEIQVVGPIATEQVDHLSVVHITQFDEKIWARFSGSVTFGYNFTKANSATQYDMASDIAYRGSTWESSATYNAVLSRFEGVTQANRWTVNLRGQHVLGRKWFTLSGANFEHNSELELDLRSSLMGGIGRYLRRSNRTDVRLAGGMLYSREKYAIEPVRNNAEGVVTASARFFKLYSPKIDLLTEFYLIPSISDAGRVRMELNSGLKIEVFVKDFFWNVSFYNSYDSRPPKETSSQNDYGFVTGISWTFRK